MKFQVTVFLNKFISGRGVTDLKEATSYVQMTNTDHYLIEETLKGNTQAFSELVERYQDFVFTLALRIIRNREEAEEVAQDSFIKAYEALSGYRGESKFSSWLYSIVYRKALDRIRKNKRTRTIDMVEEITEGEFDGIENALGYMETHERNERIQQGIDALPELEATIITLFYFEDFSIREISDVVKLSEDNVKIKLYRSRQKLFSLLKYYVLPEYTNSNGRAI